MVNNILLPYKRQWSALSISSLACVLQPPRQEVGGFLSNVGSVTQFGFAVLLQTDVPSLVLVGQGSVGVLMVLLQVLQEVTVLCHS